MTMKNMAEELAMLDALLILFQIYKNQKRPVEGFDDTSDEEVDLGEYANPRGRRRGERQW